MGNALRNILRFPKRRQPSEELDKLVVQIKELEGQLTRLVEQRSGSAWTLLYTVFGLCAVFIAYFWFTGESKRNKILMVAATAAASICLYLMVNYLLLGVFDYFIRYKRKRVQFFTERKLSIIEDVKENEKFKVAKEIIEKYGTEEERRQLLGGGPDSKEAKSQVDSSAENQMELETADAQKQGTPNQPRVPKLYENSVGRFSYRTPVRPFVEQSHTPIDRVLDYVMGENISNRYALICANCRHHNGMALREEYDYVSYFCYKCSFYNPSRKETATTTMTSSSSSSLSNAVNLVQMSSLFEDSPQRLPPTKKQQLISEKPIAEQRELLGLLSGSTKGEEQLSSSITKLSSSNPTATLQQQQEEEEESESDGAHSQSDSPSGETNNESDGFERLADIESDS